MTNQIIVTDPAKARQGVITTAFTPDLDRKEFIAQAEQLAEEISNLLPGDAAVGFEWDIEGGCFHLGLDGDAVFGPFDGVCSNVFEVEQLALDLESTPADKRIEAVELVFD